MFTCDKKYILGTEPEQNQNKTIVHLHISIKCKVESLACLALDIFVTKSQNALFLISACTSGTMLLSFSAKKWHIFLVYTRADQS